MYLAFNVVVSSKNSISMTLSKGSSQQSPPSSIHLVWILPSLLQFYDKHLLPVHIHYQISITLQLIIQLNMADEFTFPDYDWSTKLKIGAGSYGIVYKVQNKKNNQWVAVKQMDMGVLNKDTFLLNALKNQIEVMKEVKGEPYVVQLFDFSYGKKYTYMIMDLCQGDLRKKMEKNGGKLNQMESIIAMTQIMKGIKSLVDKGYIHRDLKPQNTLTKDFGFVTKADIKGGKKLNDCCGTPLYMAPQLLSEKPYTSKSDIWSVGIILFQMIFGYSPWPCRTLETYKNNILNKALAFPYNAKIGENTKDFIKKCLVVDQQKRINWENIFNHPLIKDKDVGEQAETVKLPGEVIDILRKIQDKAKKNDVDILDVLSSATKEKVVDQKKFNQVVENIDEGISQMQKRMLFYALDQKQDGVVGGQQLKKILVENDFRDVNDIAARLQSQLTQVIKLKNLDIKEMFRGADKNKTGSIDLLQFKNMLKQLMPGLSDQNFRTLWNKFDRNKSGDISLTEFISAIEIASSRKGQVSSHKKNIQNQKAQRGVQSLKKAISLYKISLNDMMKHFDRDKDNKIDFSQFGKLVICIDKYVKEEQLKEMYKILDSDGSGSISMSQLRSCLGVK